MTFKDSVVGTAKKIKTKSRLAKNVELFLLRFPTSCHVQLGFILLTRQLMGKLKMPELIGTVLLPLLDRGKAQETSTPLRPECTKLRSSSFSEGQIPYFLRNGDVQVSKAVAITALE